MAERFNFTKAAIERLPMPAARTYYRDTRETRLGLYVTEAGTKSFFAAVTIDGKTRRIPVGKFPATSIPLARMKAAETATQVAKGTDPVAAKREAKAASVTLREVLHAYLEARDLKESTKADYRRAIRESFGAWIDKPLAGITEQKVLSRYLERGKISKARTDNAARVLGALFRFAKATYKKPGGQSLFPSNPVDVLKEAKVRFKPQRKRTVVSAQDLPAWWGAVQRLANPTARDYLIFLLLTGTRREEAARLRWSDVNLTAGTFYLSDPKNRTPVTLPLPRYMVELLEPRAEDDGWVFPATTGRSGYLSDPRKSIATVRRESGVSFAPHDLRRTYTSVANGLDISVYTVKALLNHRLNQADVTAGYDVPDMDRLKRASARIEDKILRLAGHTDTHVVELRAVG